MRRIGSLVLALVAAGAAVLPIRAGAQNATRDPAAGPRGPTLRIGVLDLTGSALSMQTEMAPGVSSTSIAIPPPADFARGLTQMLITTLVDQKRYVVLERSQLERILGEQDFTASGRVTPETSIRLGKLLGAQVLVTGDITEFSYAQSSLGSKGTLVKGLSRELGLKGDRITAQVAIDLRFLDATTGEVLGSARGEGKASSTGVAADLRVADNQVGLGAGAQTPLGQASRHAIADAVARLTKRLDSTPWRGRVSDVRGADIYINAGSNLGIAVGMEFDILAEEKPVIDPSTGQALGAPIHETGRIAITSVAEKYAIGRVVAGGGFQRNDLVRFRGRP